MSTEQVAIVGDAFVHASSIERVAAHHCLPLHKLVIPADGSVVACVYRGDLLEFRSPVLVAADVAQAMRSSGPSVAVFVPAVEVTRGLSLRASAPLVALSGREAAFFSDAGRALIRDLDQTPHAMDLMSARLLSSTRVDKRVRAVLAAIDDANPSEARVLVSALAANIGLSASRLSHLFAAHAGTSLRAWLSLKRSVHAVRRFTMGARLADAAREAGFADQAHLSRTLRGHFGRTAGTIRSAIVQDVRVLSR